MSRLKPERRPRAQTRRVEGDLSPFVWLWCGSATLLAGAARALVTLAHRPAEPLVAPAPAFSSWPPAVTDSIPQAAD